MMTITLVLPEALERGMKHAASRAGLSIEEYALRILERSHALQKATPHYTGAELIAFWKREGVIGSRPDIDDPVRFALDLRERSQNRWHG